MRQKKAQQILERVKEIYNEIGRDFSLRRQYFDNYFEIFSPYLKSKQKIVDLGCGNGRLIKFLEEKIGHKNFEYTGIDNSESLLKEAEKAHSNYNFAYGDQLKIPLEKEYADVLFNIRAFHHIPSKKLQLESLLEMRRVLKENGFLVLTVWNLWRKKRLKYLLKAILRAIYTFGRYGFKDTFIPWGKAKLPRYYHAFTMAELKKLFTMAGFKIFALKRSTHSDYYGKSDSDVIVIAQKTIMEPLKKHSAGGTGLGLPHFLPAGWAHEKRIRILGVPFDNLTSGQVLNLVLEKIKKPPETTPLFIATPNPEMLLEAQNNIHFKEVLRGTSLNVADGFGIILAARWQKTPLMERITGVDLMQKICEKSPPQVKIFLLGAAPGVAEKVKTVLAERYKNIKIVVTFAGSYAPGEEKQIQNFINKSGAEVLFVAFGAPKQELWLARNLPHLHTVKVAMGVGGAFDFIAEKRRRAPLPLQKLGLEWVFRLIQEPKRLKRIYNAVVKFPFIFLTRKF